MVRCQWAAPPDDDAGFAPPLSPPEEDEDDEVDAGADAGADDEDDDEDEDDDVVSDPDAPAAGALAPPLPPRKSVTYQPEPLSWNPAAVSCFLKLPAVPQDGQSVSGASLIFCSTSFPWPQASQR